MKVSKETEEKFLEIADKLAKKTLEDVSTKLETPEFNIEQISSDKKQIMETIQRQIDENFEVKRISEKNREHSDQLHAKNIQSFDHVGRMYRVGFYVGVALIISAIGLFLFNGVRSAEGVDTTTGNYISAFLGSLGVTDMTVLMLKPIRELQRSRGNLSKLTALVSESQFISIWSGKTYGILYDMLKKGKKIDGDTEKLLNEMRWLLELKSDTVVKLSKQMTDMITHIESSTLKATISFDPKTPEVNQKINLEANVYGISAADAEKAIYSWSESTGKITINNKDKRKADFTHDKSGEFTINLEVKVGDKTGSAISPITIKHKVTAKAEPEETEKDKEVKLTSKVEGLEEETLKELSYKWEKTKGKDVTITDDTKSEAKVKPQNPDSYEFTVKITKDSESFAEKTVKVKVT